MTMNINRFQDRYRHELKYIIGIISSWDYRELSRIFRDTLKCDPHSNEQGEYFIRSVYFDTLESTDYYDKVDGILRRKKIRIRVYHEDQPDAKLEIKNRVRDLVYKESSTIPREDALALIAGDRDVLLKRQDATLNNAYYHMSRDLYRPVVMVDYEREAFVGPTDDIRITFDKNIRGSSIDFDLYNKQVTTLPAFDEESVILEVKFKDVLPDWIKDILKYRDSERMSISKYYFTRIIHYR
jgi:VTC domain